MFSKKKTFARWKTEINAWNDVVKATKSIAEEAIGQVVALSMPDSADEGDLRGKVMDALGDTLKGAGGFKILLDWLESHLGTDSTSDTIDKIRSFMKHARAEDQSVKDYVSGFDAKYNAAVKSGLDKLPECYLMWLVVENAEVSDTNHKLIMANIDLEAKETLYKQAKASLIKFMDGPCARKKEKEEGMRVRNDALFSKIPQGWQPRQPYRPRFPIGQGGAGGFRAGGAGAFAGAPGGAQGGGFRPRTQITMPRNPVVRGKQNLCDLCGSWSHYKRDCPSNPNAAMYGQVDGEEYAEGVYHQDEEFEYVSEKAEVIHEEVDKGEDQRTDYVSSMIASLKTVSHTNIVETLYTSYHILKAEVEERAKHLGEVVLDTGCIESVTGDVWANDMLMSLHPNTREKVKVEASSRRFKFGGGQTRDSMGLSTSHVPWRESTPSSRWMLSSSMIFLVFYQRRA